MKRYHVARDPVTGRVSSASGPAVVTAGLRVYFVDGKLHRPDGPAAESNRGTRLWYWRGVRVPRDVIETPRAMPPAEILREPNVEVRRARMECYGLDDCLLDLARDGHAKIVHQTRKPRRRLWRITAIKDVDEAHPQYVEVDCPSTDRVYFLRVAPEHKTCEAAVASTFRMSAAGYSPSKET